MRAPSCSPCVKGARPGRDGAQECARLWAGVQACALLRSIGALSKKRKGAYSSVPPFCGAGVEASSFNLDQSASSIAGQEAWFIPSTGPLRSHGLRGDQKIPDCASRVPRQVHSCELSLEHDRFGVVAWSPDGSASLPKAVLGKLTYGNPPKSAAFRAFGFRTLLCTTWLGIPRDPAGDCDASV